MDLSTCRVLIIDDNLAARKIVRSVFEGLVGGVYEAPGGLEGIRAWRRLQPDLVIVDFEMPQVNGPVVTKYIRREEARADRRTAVLLMTGHGDLNHVETARRADVDGMIGKPLTVGLLLGRAAEALARSEQRRKALSRGVAAPA